jgi:periplasmic mercuric ion binding protein
MKTKLFFLSLFFITFFSFAQQPKVVKATLTVYGNCELCKARIEAALDQRGIKQSKWNTQTKALSIIYNPVKISELQIHQFIAAVGHDTDKVKAKDEVYAELPYCCHYRDHDMPADSHNK